MRREFYNLKLTISHLVVNGCSLTYGHGIANPLENAWPSLVAQKLGVPLVNLAFPGQSNHAIERRTHAYLIKDIYKNNNPFYIHAYTQSQRQELYLSRNKCNDQIQSWQLIDGSDKVTPLEKEFVLNMDDYAFNLLEQKKFEIWHQINCMLDHYNIPHFSTDYMTQSDPKIIDWIKKHHYLLYSTIYSHPGKITNFAGLTSKEPKTPCKHETESGHIIIANYIYDMLQTLYDEIEVVEKPYTTLHETYVESPCYTEYRIENPNAPFNHQHPREWGVNLYYINELGLDWKTHEWAGHPDDYHR